VKAGFWIAPEGEDTEMAVLPIGAESAPRAVNFLATSTAGEMIKRCAATAELLPRLADALARQKDGERGKGFDITDFPADDRQLISQVLGEGEVGGVAALRNGIVAQIQESVMAGLWRVRFTDAEGHEIGDYIEVGAYPEAVNEACAFASGDILIGAPPEGAMNVMPVLAEIQERVSAYRPGDDNHVMTFSLFPMTPEDMTFLQDTLGPGPVTLVSRGYGSCRIAATAARGVWSVQFYNSMETIVLDTLEIGGVPARRARPRRIFTIPPNDCAKSRTPISNERLREFRPPRRPVRRQDGMRRLLACL
jgi:hydrogenase-1 operon protein HyaF